MTAIRKARADDALHVAAIVDMAGHGIDLEYWQVLAGPGGSPLAAARHAILTDKSLPYHLSKAWIAEHPARGISGGVTGGIVAEGDLPMADAPEYLRPLLELESQAVGFWTIVAIAVYPDARRLGIARKLIATADSLARAAGAKGVSLVVESDNTEAIALYQTLGYALAATRPWIPFGGRKGTREWHLMVRSFAVTEGIDQLRR